MGPYPNAMTAAGLASTKAPSGTEPISVLLLPRQSPEPKLRRGSVSAIRHKLLMLLVLHGAQGRN
jgi:hypothetical protein